VNVGQSLAEARRRAGLSITEVSERTRIRAAVIRMIEAGDYAACGGDFYARGHIRAIARVLGVDPGPLIEEYDAAHRPPETVSAAELLRPARPARPYERRRSSPVWLAVLGLVLAAGAGFAAYNLVPGLRQVQGTITGAASGLHRPGRHHSSSAARSVPPSPPAPSSSPALSRSPAPHPYAHKVVVRLAAVEDCWVEFTTPSVGYLFQTVVTAGTTRSWVFRHPVNMRLGNPGGITLTVDGKHPLPPGTILPVTLHLGLNGRVSGSGI
jgi:transcriptional regulator with XRE-family HTH domain